MNAAPKTQARLTGLLYLFIMVAAMFTEIAVRGTLIVSGDASATAGKILSAESLYRLGGGLDILTYAADVAVAAFLFELTKPAGRYLATVAAFFRLAYSAMAGVLCFYAFSALNMFHGHGLEGFTETQQHALAFSQIQLRNTGFVVALIFFGVHLLLLGLSLIKSRYFPAWIGALLMLAGAGYVINSFVDLLFPALDFGPWLLLPGLGGEGAFTLWLLIAGLDQEKWSQRVAT